MSPTRCHILVSSGLLSRTHFMYNLIEYSNNYSKASGSLWKYCKDIQPVNNDGNIANFNEANATDSFHFKIKITGQTENNGRIDNVEIMFH